MRTSDGAGASFGGAITCHAARKTLGVIRTRLWTQAGTLAFWRRPGDYWLITAPKRTINWYFVTQQYNIYLPPTALQAGSGELGPPACCGGRPDVGPFLHLVRPVGDRHR